MFYLLQAFLLAMAALIIIYLVNRRHHVVAKDGSKRWAATISSIEISDFIREHKHPYILDIRSDEKVELYGLRHSGPLIVMYIPFDSDQEGAFVRNVLADSRMRTALAEKQDILIICDRRDHGARVLTLLAGQGFESLQIYDDLLNAPSDLLRVVTPRKQPPAT